MAVWMTSWASLRKKKGVALSMVLLIALAAAMLNVGVTLLTGIGDFYYRANDELRGSHYIVSFYADEYKDEYLEFFQNDNRVEYAQMEETVRMDMATFPGGGAISAIFFVPDETLPVTGYRLETLADVPEDQAVYLPEFMKQRGYLPGDLFTLNFKKEPYSFYVAGYSQSTWLQSSVSTLTNFYVPQASFDRIYSRAGGGYNIGVRVYDRADIPGLREDFKNGTDVKIEAITLDSTVMDLSIEDMKNGATMLVNILSAILLAFSLLIVLVALLVIRFRIGNHIETQMQNIGAMEAMGFTGAQIRQSIALEFLILGAFGSALGILASYGIIASLGNLITHSVGVSFRANGHAASDIFCGGTVLLTVFSVAWTVAGKAAKILPVEALRGGIHAHNFSRNHFSLEKCGDHLTAALGLKHIFYQPKTYVLIGAVFTGVAFALAFAVVFYQNMGLDDKLMLEMSGYEISDILVSTAPHADYERLTEEIEGLDGVEKTSLYETSSVSVEGNLVMSYISDDFGKMETVKSYEGYLPEYDNEIVLTGVLAKSLGKGIGDTVEVTSEGLTAEYIICGLAQTMSNFGQQCYISLSGLSRIRPLYRPKTIQVYLAPGLDPDEFIMEMEQKFNVLSPSSEEGAENRQMTARRKADEKVRNLLSMYGVDSAQYALMKDGEIVLSGDTNAYQIDKIENNHKLFISNVDSITAAVGLVSAIILAGTLIIITLVFYMVIKSMIVRRSREFGVYKAVGYTSRQLMEQIAVSFMPSVIGGTTAGCLLAVCSVNRLSSLLFEGIGISRMTLNIRPEVLLLMGICLMAYSFLICMTVAGRIGRISVYELMME